METMKELNMETCPLSMDAEWCPLVNSRADRAEEKRKQRLNWAEQQKANRKTERRVRRAMNAVALALALITGGGIYLNYVEECPVWIAVSVAVGGVTILAFVLGWIFGHRARRY